MSFELAASRGYPEKTTVSHWMLWRLLDSPVLQAGFKETVRAWEESVVVDDATDNGSGYDLLLVSGWAARIDDLVGRKVFNRYNEEIGVIADFDAQFSEVTLEAGLAEDPTGMTIKIRKRNQFDRNVLVPAAGGAEWEIKLDGEDEESSDRLKLMLFSIYVEAATHVLTELGHVNTDAEIQTAISSLAEQGIDLDILISNAIQELERERWREEFAPSEVIGEAPVF